MHALVARPLVARPLVARAYRGAMHLWQDCDDLWQPHYAVLGLGASTATKFPYTYSIVQLQLHITTCYHACKRVLHAKSSRVPRCDSTWLTSTSTSNIAMCVHAWQLIVQGCNVVWHVSCGG